MRTLTTEPWVKVSKEIHRWAIKAVAPYRKAGRLQTIKDGALPIPGVQVIAANEHIPGHTTYLFGTGANRLLLWGPRSSLFGPADQARGIDRH